MVLYHCLLIAILVIVTFAYELFKVLLIHYTVTVITNPSHCGYHRTLVIILHNLII